MSFEIVYNTKPLSHHVHTHIHYELLFIKEGAIKLTIHNKEYCAKAGDLVFLNKLEEHASKLTYAPYHRYYLLIPSNMFKAFHNDARLLSIFRLHGGSFPYVISTGTQMPLFLNYFTLLYNTHKKKDPFMNERIEAILTLILTDAYKLRPDMFSLFPGTTSLPIQPILDEIDKNFSAAFSLETLAQRFHVSPGYLSVHFKRFVGLSPMQYVTQSRLTHAKLLLLKTDLSILDISTQSGFNDVSNFVRRFREQFNCTPYQFRKEHLHSAPVPMPSSLSGTSLI